MLHWVPFLVRCRWPIRRLWWLLSAKGHSSRTFVLEYILKSAVSLMLTCLGLHTESEQLCIVAARAHLRHESASSRTTFLVAALSSLILPMLVLIVALYARNLSLCISIANHHLAIFWLFSDGFAAIVDLSLDIAPSLISAD